MNVGEREWLTAKEAVKLLGVKLQTLYAYTSRGLVTSVAGPRGAGRRYSASDLAKLKGRHDARAGHAAVAGGALRWGEPVLETRISEVRATGPRYRGYAVKDLLADGVGFERASELLFTGALPCSQVTWCTPPQIFPASLRGLRIPEQPIPGLAAVLSCLALEDDLRVRASDTLELTRARGIIALLAASVRGVPARLPPQKAVAQLLLEAYGHAANGAGLKLIDRALVLCADHELNASTFAARVAASTGAALCASMAAGMHALSGYRHGGGCERVEALREEASTLSRAKNVVAARLMRGDALPGFGHPLYPAGDPRAQALLAFAREIKRPPAPHLRMRAIIEAAQQAGQPAPTLDAALVYVSSALGLPRGAASAIFAVGRLAGWVAHILEQRAQGYLLRPRAHYVGEA